MSFSVFVSDYLLKRIADERAIVVRDQKGHYRAICEGLKERGVTVLDADRPSLDVRDTVGRLWMQMAEDSEIKLLVYRSRVPENSLPNQVLKDPLASFEQIMGLFPQAGAAHESLHSLARTAYAGREDEVDALFDGEEPSVATLDSLEGDNRYPTLTGLFGDTNPIDMLVRLMDSGSDALERALASAGARSELTQLTTATLGVAGEQVKTASEDASEIRSALWRVILFSEFVLDLPVELPGSFKAIAHAPKTRQNAVFSLCSRLRNDPRTRMAYVDAAERVADELDLESLLEHIEDFGSVDTFAFENTAALKSVVRALLAERPEEAQPVVDSRSSSLWADYDATLRSVWPLIREAISVFDALAKAPAPGKNDDIVAWYRQEGKQVDRAYRSFVLSYARLENEEPYGAPLPELMELLSDRYRAWLDLVQGVFLGVVKAEGWPLPDLLPQPQLFAKSVTPRLDNSQRVVYFLIDALRYELAEALAAKLEPELRVERDCAAALLPTKTPLGMAALAPPSAGEIAVSVSNGSFVVSRGGKALTSAADRDGLYKSLFGDTALVETLEKWIGRSKKQRPEEKIRLAVIRSTEIDSAGHEADAILRASLESLMANLAKGVRKAFDFGFDAAVVTADHGFIYIPKRPPGDQVPLPEGTVGSKGDRYAVGKIEPSDSVLVFDETALGYSVSDGLSVAVPASAGCFSKPSAYAHEGLSLQEALIPVFSVERVTKKKARKAEVSLLYKQSKSGKATSLTPLITVAVAGPGAHLDFDEEWAMDKVEIELSVLLPDSEDPIGQVSTTEFLDKETGYLSIPPGTTTTIPVRLDEEHRGLCVVRAADPATGKLYDTITIDVDILD